jgi:hypothetical protein
MSQQGLRGSADQAEAGMPPITTAASRDRSRTRGGATTMGDDDDEDNFTDRVTRRAEVLAAQYGSPVPRKSQGRHPTGKRGGNK